MRRLAAVPPSLLAALLAGCAPQPRSCTLDAHCAGGEVCDLERFRCEAAAPHHDAGPAPDAGAPADAGPAACTPGACGPDAECAPAPGGLACRCLPGFARDGGACADVDECLAGAGACGEAALCTNTRGGHRCACSPGFAGDGGTCVWDDASLASLDLRLDGPVPLAVDLVPGARDQQVLWPSESSTRLLVTPAAPNPAGVVLSVDGRWVESGGTVPVELVALPATVAVQVAARSGRFQQTLLHLASDLRLRTTFKPSNPGGPAPLFGGAVALSADGSTLAVGAAGEASGASGVDGDALDTSAPAAGAVYVFGPGANSWVLQGYLKASGARAGARFGASLALSADGSTLVVGAPGAPGSAPDGGPVPEAGAALVFVRGATGAWSQVAALAPASPAPLEAFGAAVAIDGAGAALLVGAPGALAGAGPGDGGAAGAGAAYLYGRDAGTWAPRARLEASNAGAQDRFGAAVALAAGGATLAVSAPHEASAAQGVGGGQADDSAPWRGAVYVFAAAGGWAQQGYLKPPAAGPGTELGSGLALSGDGSALAASSREGPGREAAVVLYRREAGAWAVEAEVRPRDRSSLGGFGQPAPGGAGPPLALDAAGATLAVGDALEWGAAAGVGGDPTATTLGQSGAAFVFRRGAAGWAQAVYVKAPLPRAGVQLGTAVALSADGRTLALGAPEDPSASQWPAYEPAGVAAPHRGAVHLYRR